MQCPRCVGAGGGGESAYRGGFVHGSVVHLVEEKHRAGVTIQRCPSCRGAFVEYEDLKTIENRAERGSAASGARQRAWDPPTEAIACPSCQSETTRREWSIGTLLFVDVCIECRGVWLDGGELEAIGGARR
ncbi:MAG: zf-TFIIB domain-containing protein [Labilithrix sp.]